MDEAIETLQKFAAEQAEKEKRDRKCCGNCGWFASKGDEPIGDCHRYPPTLDTVGDDEWKHARTSRDNVCGEFVHNRTGDSFQPDPFRSIAVRLARAEEELDRLRRAAATE